MIGVNKEYIPLFFESFSGNVSDVEMFQDSLRLLRTKFSNLLTAVKNKYVVLDNGNISDDKFKTMLELDKFCKKHETYFIAGLKRKKVQKELLAMKLALDSPIYCHDKTELFGYCLEKELYGKRRKILLYYNPKTAAREKRTFTKKLTKTRAAMAEINRDDDLTLAVKKERIENVLRKAGLLTVFKREEAGDQIHCWINTQEKAKRLNLCGKAAIFSNNLSLFAKDMICIYKAKSKVEHEFRLLKNCFSIRAVNHKKPNRIKTHIAIVMWGIMLVALLKHVLQQHQMQYSFEALVELIKEGQLTYGEYNYPELKKKYLIYKTININTELEQIFKKLKLSYDYFQIEVGPTKSLPKNPK